MKRTKEQYNAYMKQYMKKRAKNLRLEWIEKLGGKCAKCKTTNDLEFDHIKPETKLYTIAQVWSFAKVKVEKELKKCQLLCKKCHNEKTLKDLKKVSAKITHGTLSSYRYCKCGKCRKAKSDWQQEYIRKKKSSAN